MKKHIQHIRNLLIDLIDIKSLNQYFILLKFYCKIFSVLFLALMIFQFFNENYFSSIISGISAIIFFTILLMIKREKAKTQSIYVFNYFLGILAIYNVMHFDYSNPLLFLSVLYPLVIFSTSDYKKGLFYSLVVIFISSLLYINHIFLFSFHEEQEAMLIFIILYLCICLFMYIYKYVNDKRKLIEHNKYISNKNIINKNTQVISEHIHQLRTNANSIIAAINFLYDKNPDNTQKEYIKSISTSINNLLNASSKIDDLARTGEKILFENQTHINIQRTIKDFIKQYKDGAILKNLQYSINISKNVPQQAFGLPEKTKQILYNILEAIFVSTDSYKIKIDIFLSTKLDTDNYSEILTEIQTNSILTSHISFDNDISDNTVSDDFYFNNQQLTFLDKAKDNLVLCKNISQQLNGNFGITLKKENTTIFWFTIPLWKTIKDNKTLTDDTKINKQLKPKKLSDAKILVVEDNHINQRLLVLGIEDFVKSIDIANNGKEAVDLFTNNKYDIILMDINLPILDGFKATERIRELESGLDTHVLIIGLSAILMDEIIKQCQQSGIDKYISKPYKTKDLLIEMESLLHNHSE